MVLTILKKLNITTIKKAAIHDIILPFKNLFYEYPQIHGYLLEISLKRAFLVRGVEPEPQFTSKKPTIT